MGVTTHTQSSSEPVRHDIRGFDVFFYFFFRKMLSRSELGLCQLTQPVGKSYNAE